MRVLFLAILMSLSIPGLAGDADLIQGYRTNDFLTAIPEQVDDMHLRMRQSDPSKHAVTAYFGNKSESRKAQVMVYASPEGTSTSEYLEKVIKGTLDATENAGRPLAQRSFTTSQNIIIKCIDSVQNQSILHSTCLAPIKGRIIDVQPISVAKGKITNESFAKSEKFVGALFDSFEKF